VWQTLSEKLTDPPFFLQAGLIEQRPAVRRMRWRRFGPAQPKSLHKPKDVLWWY